jgi:hypothetical protein
MTKLSGLPTNPSPVLTDYFISEDVSSVTDVRVLLSDMMAAMISGGLWWQELGRTTLGSAGTTITISSFTARKYLRVMGYLYDNGAAVVGNLTFNNDSGSNYAMTNSTSGGADATLTSQANLLMAVDSAATPRYFIIDVINISSKEKMLIGHTMSQNTAGAANAPIRRELQGKWANTAAQITRVDVATGTANNFGTGSEVVVLGHD